MKHKKNPQQNLFHHSLEHICNHQQSLYRLANSINWKVFEEAFGPLYCENNGRPGKPIRLMVGLHYLKAMFSESDESMVEKWIENPYWQYFCGATEFQHEFPLEPTTLGKWRKRVSAVGLEKLLEETIATGLNAKVIKKSHLKKVNVDTTVQEKAIAYPTDAKLYHGMRLKLVKEAKLLGIELRQTYTCKSKRALFWQSRYRHARQNKKANRQVRNLKTYFGRVLRDLDRKSKDTKRSERLNELLALGFRLFKQQRGDKNKIYSLHAPEVECIAKGKSHKKYEFGCKVSFVTSSKGNFVLGAQALHGNPYDGHTLKGALDQAKQLIPENTEIEDAYLDQGYRGSSYTGINVHVVKRGLKKIKPCLRRWLKRRAAIEPLIGHMKNDGGPKRNHLLGKDGDKMNALLMACGFNLRKCLRVFSFYFFREWVWIFYQPRQLSVNSQSV